MTDKGNGRPERRPNTREQASSAASVPLPPDEWMARKGLRGWDAMTARVYEAYVSGRGPVFPPPPGVGVVRGEVLPGLVNGTRARRPALAHATPDEWAASLAEETARLRLRAEAAEIHAAEQHARLWTPPASHGPLAAELALPDEVTPWRLRGLLGVGHNALLVAGRKAGKTTMINNLARSAVDGDPFLGRFDVTPTERAVAIFNYEVDGPQYRRWLRETGIVNVDRVHVLHVRGRSLPLKNPRVRAWVISWLRDRGVGLWIVDPYSRAYVGSVDNGNDEAQVGSFLDTLDVIKAEAGVSELVMPVHTPKARADAGEETAIGSQRLEGWADSMWYLVREPLTGVRFLRAEGRDVDVPEEKLSHDAATRGLTFGGWDRAGERRNADADALIAYVNDNPGCSGRDIEAALGWGHVRVNKARSSATGKVRTTEGKNRSQLHYPC